MKRIRRKPGLFEALELYKQLSRDDDLKLDNEERDEKFINQLAQNLRIAKSNPITIYGIRAQAMFEFIVTSLNNIKLLKVEDSGDIYAIKETITPPDFRLVLNDDNEIFIEVKNFYQKDPVSPYSFKKKYFERLLEYANIFKLDLKIAIYWSKWNIWTLIDSNKFSLENNNYVISFIDAYKNNEMFLLGDLMVATIPPLEMRIVADKKRQRKILDSGLVKFYIGGIEFYCGGKLITDKKEKNIAFNLIYFSDWPISEPIAQIENENLNYISFKSEPLERTENQEFEILGSFSSMISKQFQMLTAPDGKVERISPKFYKTKLGTLIPTDYKGEQLPIWRFSIIPKYEKD